MRSLRLPGLEHEIRSVTPLWARLKQCLHNKVLLGDTDVATEQTFPVLAHHHSISTIEKLIIVANIIHKVTSLQPDIAQDLRKRVKA